MSGTRVPPSGLAPQRKLSEAELQAQAEQQLNQLVGELRLLEAYHQEILSREQAASAALSDTRSALEALSGLVQNPKSEVLLPIGGGLLLSAKDLEVRKLIVSVGAGVAIERDIESAKLFLQAREKELDKAISTLDQQRREISSRLESGRAALQQLTGQA
ncbi:MAG TPA: prefoldin subunit alpha [Nitrososphaerales archaeon]|nr:prefoldin subunit alpha [Nitrososphaerales archaeon]